MEVGGAETRVEIVALSLVLSPLDLVSMAKKKAGASKLAEPTTTATTAVTTRMSTSPYSLSHTTLVVVLTRKLAHRARAGARARATGPSDDYANRSTY